MTTTADPLALPHVRAMLAALDDGDDDCLSVLADALEEAESPLAAGLREYAVRHDGTADTMPETAGEGEARWYRYDGRRAALGWTHYALTRTLYDRVEAAETWTQSGSTTGGEYLEWNSRSAAMLALAAALAPE